MTPKEAEILERYRMRAVQAWETFDRLSDMLLEQKGTSDLINSVSEKNVLDAEAEAIRLQQAYFTQYYLTFDCTCKPDATIACDVCAAQIKAKSIYREEM